MSARLSLALLTVGLSACAADPQKTALAEVKQQLMTDLDALQTAVASLALGAPAPDADGWSADVETAAVDAMKADWKRASAAYARVGGTLAPLFPKLDGALASRYEELVQAAPDEYAFDGQGVVGL